MGKLKYLVIHCTDTPSTMKVTGKDIRYWHMAEPPRGRGWDRVGYADLIHRDGTIENLTPYNDDDEVQQHEITWGAKGINGISRHVCLVGGMPPNTHRGGLLNFEYLFTDEQFIALQRYVKEFAAKHPECRITGHNKFSAKLCPGFNVANWLLFVGVPEKNVY